MVRPIHVSVINAGRAEDARNARAISQLKHRKCRLHSSGRLGISTDHAEGQPSRHPNSRQCMEQMMANGWCPHQVQHLSKTYDSETFSYLSTLKRSPHRLADHTRCSESPACIAYNTHAATYKARHVTDDCMCSTVLTPYHDLVRIIRRGGIPLVSIECGTGATPTHKVRVHSRSAASRYIAISHVWADGLGNPIENGLPECQIGRLQASLIALQRLFGKDSELVLFWMDTLCIPVGPDEYSLRLIQIDKMASIYKNATTSLVLDAELMATVPDADQTSTEACKKTAKARIGSPRTLSLEARARIACSVWMCRSWTLQEGELPPNLAVQFKYNAVVMGRTSPTDGRYRELFTDNQDLPDERSERESEDNHSTNHGQIPPSTQRYRQNNNLLAPECECVDIVLQRTLFMTFFKEANELAPVWNELSGRSTTMPNDIPIIITNTLDFDNRNLLTYHDTADMFQAILVSQGRLPMSLFFNTGPRKTGNHQNRWVPVKVGADTLESRDWLTVHSDYLVYRHKAEKIPSNISVYVVHKILFLSSTVYLHSTKEGAIYTVESLEPTADQLDTAGFSSTCVIIDNSVSRDCPGMQKGACFYVRPNRRVSTRKGVFGRLRFWSHSVETPVLDLTFNCPLRLQKSARSQMLWPYREPLYALDCINDKCDIKINYDPIPDYKPIYARQKNFFPMFRNKGLGVVFGLVGGTVHMIVSFGGGLIVMRGSDAGLGLLVGLGFWFTGIILLMSIGELIKKLEMWRYKRSFEAIAAKRPREGLA